MSFLLFMPLGLLFMPLGADCFPGDWWYSTYVRHRFWSNWWHNLWSRPGIITFCSLIVTTTLNIATSIVHFCFQAACSGAASSWPTLWSASWSASSSPSSSRVPRPAPRSSYPWSPARVRTTNYFEFHTVPASNIFYSLIFKMIWKCIADAYAASFWRIEFKLHPSQDYSMTQNTFPSH